MSLYYAGVGSRTTPETVLAVFRAIGHDLGRRGYVLRSGGAPGADTAFEQGGGPAEVFLPWRGFNGNRSKLYPPSPAAVELVAGVHPAWGRLGHGPRALHARNAHQVLGADLATLVGFVVCWTPDGAQSENECTRDTGGTATAIRIASRRGIPVFNFARSEAGVQLYSFLPPR